MQLAASIIRVACNQASRNSFVNAIGGQAPVIPVAGSVQIPCAIFVDDPSVSTNLLTDLGNILTANIIIRQGATSTGTVLFQQVLGSTAINSALTYDQWTAGTGAQFTFTMSPTDTNLPAGQVWMAIGVTTADAGDISLVYCSNGQIKDYGIFNAAAPTAPDYTSWSKAESDARYVQIAGSLQLSTLTGLSGGGASNVDGMITATLPTYYTMQVVTFTGASLLRLELDTDPINGAQVITPVDHDPSANPRSWRVRA